MKNWFGWGKAEAKKEVQQPTSQQDPVVSSESCNTAHEGTEKVPAVETIETTTIDNETLNTTTVKEKATWKSLDELIQANILQYIPLVPKLLVVSRVNKTLKTLITAELHHGSKGKNSILDTANDDQEGRAFSYVLDHLRFEILQASLGNVSSEAKRIVKEPGDLYLLRHGGLMNDLMSLNAAVYSYWDTTPSRPNEGIIHWMEASVEASSTNTTLPPLSRYINTAFYRDVRHFKDDRIYGNFIFIFDTFSGSILVEMKTKKVYKVLGIRDSIGALVGERKPFQMFSAVIGAELVMTILPWNGDIVYDGLMACKKSKVSPDILKQAIRMYVNAVDNGNLIVTLPRLSSSAPSSSSSSRNRLGSKKAVYSGPSPESLKITLSIELDSIKSLPTDDREFMWVFRRHGYTERENPDHLVTVLSSLMSRGWFLKYI